MVKYGCLVSSNSVSCGICGTESDTKRGLSPSPLVLPSVRTTPPHLNALSFCYHRRNKIFAGVSGIDTLKIIKIYCVPSLKFLPLFLSLLLAHLFSVLLHVQ
jgi:hypothetical protein